jgi:hypothetical protein
MGKYDALTGWLRNPTAIVLTFAEIERIIGATLPQAARRHRPWWGNEKNARSRQCRSWLDAGWEVDSVDEGAETVTFRHITP